jgi:hypothetical protein
MTALLTAFSDFDLHFSVDSMGRRSSRGATFLHETFLVHSQYISSAAQWKYSLQGTEWNYIQTSRNYYSVSIYPVTPKLKYNLHNGKQKKGTVPRASIQNTE